MPRLFCFQLAAISIILAPLAQGKPNVLIIVSDDQGYADLNRTGGVIPTPTIDALSWSPETTWLENFYVHPVCTPTRAALLTGRLAASSGLSGPLLLGTPCGLPSKKQFGPNLAESFQQMGYKTILAGKWHLGHHAFSDTPTARGFDAHNGPLNCCCSYFSKQYWHPLAPNAVDWRNGRKPVAPPPATHSSEAFADALLENAREYSNYPLFMLLALTAPHSPLQPTKNHLARCAHVKTKRRRLYCGLMVSVDEAVAKVKGGLEALGIWEDTIIVYFNDNGGNAWEGGRNYPYRGGKHSSYEGGSRATSFIKLPRSMVSEQSAHRVESRLIHVSDVMPTLLSLVGRREAATLTAEEHWKSGKGYDFSDALIIGGSDAPTWKRVDVLQTFDPTKHQVAYRFGKWKLLEGSRGDGTLYGEPGADSEWIMESFSLHKGAAEILMSLAHLIDEDSSGTLSESIRELLGLVDTLWSQILSGTFSLNAEQPAALYNLEVDPYESADVAAQNPEIVSMLRARVSQLEEKFAENCNWFITDLNVRHETVSWTEKDVTKTALYHAPFVSDEDWESGSYEPSLFDVNPARIYGAWALVVVEVIVVVYAAAFFTRRVFMLSTMEKEKQS